MRTFKKHLEDNIKDPEFRDHYSEEKKLIELSLKIHEAREKSGLSQIEVAKRAHVTQQQLSKIENGRNCNIMTFLKVCHALGLDFDFISKAVS
ncbi:MAG: transcriptional regulator [Spirochaetaceae bacterium 4572_59]|nr:MAG: transcriptional regulator [Spirochaetaceae bacterium 4572_59]